MNTNYYLKEVGHIVVLCIYPLVELYGYFVYVGILGLDGLFFKTWTLTVCMMLYSLFLSLKIILYLQIQATKYRSTLQIFPTTLENSAIRLFTNINPFIIEGQMVESAEKIQSCDICETYKPPRTHHCMRCNRCFLKYDHHNYFLDLCIAFHNYKLFVQFVIINFASCLLFLIVISLDLALQQDITTLSVSNMIVSLSVVGIEFLIFSYYLIFHIYLISNNETTIEYKSINKYLERDYSYMYVFQEGQIKSFSSSRDRKVLNPYNLGIRRNWKEVFGKDAVMWFLPVFSSRGNGVLFKTNTDSSNL